jgi:hypothetical protein
LQNRLSTFSPVLGWMEYGVEMTKADVTSWNPQVGPRGFSDLIVE